MLCRFKSCGKCGGDLMYDEGDWRCMQCSQYYYGHGPSFLEQSHLPGFKVATCPPQDIPELLLEMSADGQGEGAEVPRRGRRRGSRARAMRGINSVIQAKAAGESKWWDRNHAIIDYLDQGLPVREVARLTNRGQRQVRTVKERLTDIREVALVNE